MGMRPKNLETLIVGGERLYIYIVFEYRRFSFSNLATWGQQT